MCTLPLETKQPIPLSALRDPPCFEGGGTWVSEIFTFVRP